MMLEPLLLFEAVLIENRPVHRLIDSDFGTEAARCPVGTRQKRAGGLTDASYSESLPAGVRRSDHQRCGATMTSSPERSQPITRGAWMLTVIFNNLPSHRRLMYRRCRRRTVETMNR